LHILLAPKNPRPLKESTFYVSSKFYLSVEFEIIKPT